MQITCPCCNARFPLEAALTDEAARQAVAEAITVEELPASLRELVEVIGLPAALALVEHWGGIRLWVPVELRDDHPLIARLGRDAAERLVQHYAGETISVPRCAAALRRMRDRRIRERYQHETAASLAREYGCTERWIWYVVSRAGEDNDPQAGLF